MSIINSIEIMIFGAYTIKLDAYLSKYYHKDFQKFKIYRNSIVSDFVIIAYIFSFLVLTFGNSVLLLKIVFILHILFFTWLLKNWNFYQKFKEKWEIL